MEFSALKAKAEKISQRLGRPDLSGDVLSELFIIFAERGENFSDRELSTIIARELNLAVAFQEINESQSTVDEDGEEKPSLLEIQSDEVTAESLIMELEAPIDYDAEEKKRKDDAGAKLKNRSFDLTREQEDFHFMRSVLGLKAQEIAELSGRSAPTVYSRLRHTLVDADMSVFDDCGTVIDWIVM